MKVVTDYSRVALFISFTANIFFVAVLVSTAKIFTNHIELDDSVMISNTNKSFYSGCILGRDFPEIRTECQIMADMWSEDLQSVMDQMDWRHRSDNK